MKINHMFTETKRTRRASVALLFGLAMICVLLLGLQAAKPAHAVGTTFTVNSTNDPGDDGTCDATECTLREAITAANATSAADTINFNIPSSDCDTTTQVCTIAPGSGGLPTITKPVTIDGYTQSGASKNASTEPDKTSAVLTVELEGVFAGSSGIGLRIDASKVVIKGLVIHDFDKGIELVGGTGNKVQGNFIGPNGADNFIGVHLSGADASTIGGTDADDGKVDEVVEARNVISSNTFSGVLVDGGSSGNKILGNLIGTDKDGNPDANTNWGVVIGPDAESTGNRILSNSIFSNGESEFTSCTTLCGLGINLRGGTEGANEVTINDDKDPDTGPNRLQNYPELDPVLPGDTVISGKLNSTPSTTKKKRTFTIQFFSSPSEDPSHFGEGKTYLGQIKVRTDRQGNATFAFFTQQLSAGQSISATATNNKTGDTSEFSKARVVTEPGPV